MNEAILPKALYTCVMAKKKPKLLNRDISWLSFNERVLQEAIDKSVPLIERIRFLGIYANNRDEFFRVRVATLQRLLKLGGKHKELIGENPSKVAKNIQQIVNEQQGMLEEIYQKKIAELAAEKIFLVDETKLSTKQQTFVRNYFLEKILPFLYPLMVSETGKFPYLRDRSAYLFVRLKGLGIRDRYRHFLIELPTRIVSRFIVLPDEGTKKYIILLDDIIRFCMDELFYMFDYETADSHMIKITRDAELDIEYDFSKSMIEKITRSLKGRRIGRIVRFTYDLSMPPAMVAFLTRKMKLGKENNISTGGRYHNFRDFMDFPQLGGKHLYYPKLQPIIHPAFDHERSLFKTVSKNDILLHFPYHSYSHILDFLREASIDPGVESISLTLYRAARHSSVANALINAAKNGKMVTVVVELQARFDEEANIQLAQRLQEEGVRVVHGVPGLKVHSKLMLVIRKEGKKRMAYAHIGTGNFNENTARIYSDFSLLTANPKITEEVEDVFAFYNDNLRVTRPKQLLVAPFFYRKRILQMIQKEIDDAVSGKPGYIHAKMNSLVDFETIHKLYEASCAGVKIKLIIRGTCALVPGVKGMSENIEIISIIDKFLEHSRLFIFANGGDEKVYIASADWMMRNFDQRSEVAVPIIDEALRNMLREIFNIQFSDNTKARIIDENQENIHRPTSGKKIRAQDATYAFLKRKAGDFSKKLI
jgi:polyphosphate kinase